MLVRRAGPGGIGRLAMLETVRQFALERLARGGEHDRARRRHFDYYAQLAADNAPRLSTAEQRAALALLDPEIHNLRAALEWALEAAPAGALALAGDLGEYWLAREELLEKRWLNAALHAAGEQAPVTDRARAWLLWARMLRLDDDPEVLTAGARSALDLYTEAGDDAGIAMALLEAFTGRGGVQWRLRGGGSLSRRGRCVTPAKPATSTCWARCSRGWPW